jgi:hypothetical protein
MAMHGAQGYYNKEKEMMTNKNAPSKSCDKHPLDMGDIMCVKEQKPLTREESNNSFRNREVGNYSIAPHHDRTNSTSRST